jgi:hypothetical protein
VGSAVLTAGAAVVLVAAAYLHLWIFAGVLAVGQAVLAAGWFTLVRGPGAAQGVPIAVAAALLADFAVLRQRADPSLAPLAVVLGLVLVAALFQQVVSPASRSGATASMAATVSGGAVVLLPVAYPATWALQSGDLAAGPASAVVACVAGGAAVAALLGALPLADTVRILAALAAAGLAGGVLGRATAVGDPVDGAVLALAGGGLALVGRLVTEYGDSSAQASRSVVALLPLALGGPAAYLLGHFLMG